MSSPVEQIKNRLNIVDVISGYLKLEKAGVNYKARCPFHNEKTPSFFVSPSRDSYHCFGCNRGGDLISFTQEIEGMDFREALGFLAERAGVELRPVDQKEELEKDRILRLLESATDYFEKELSKKGEAVEYLKKRGLTDAIIKDFRLGFASSEWRNVSPFLLAKGFKDEEIEKAGLSIKTRPTDNFPNGRFYDRFRGRIIFPLFDSKGKVVGFSGRLFGVSSEEEKEAKYINSPATIVYDKSKVLYGLDRAKVEMRKKGTAILVEGQMDLILSHQAGFLNTVAVSGTALTENHVEAVRRLAGKFIMAFDADLDGISASRRGVDMALSQGFDVAIAKLPEGKDPADLILVDKEKWAKVIGQAKHVIDFYLEVLTIRFKDKRELAKGIRLEVYPYISALSYSIDQAFFIAKIAHLLNMDEQRVWEDFHQNVKVDSGHVKDKNENLKLEKTRKEKLEEKIFGILFWGAEKKNEKFLVKDLDKKLEVLYKNKYDVIRKMYEEQSNQLAIQIDLLYGGYEEESLMKDVNELMIELEQELLKIELENTLSDLKIAEKKRDELNIDKLAQKCQNITQAINNLKNH